jgi:hypothetical protein
VETTTTMMSAYSLSYAESALAYSSLESGDSAPEAPTTLLSTNCTAPTIVALLLPWLVALAFLVP